MASQPSSPPPFWAQDPTKRLADSQAAMAQRVAEIHRISDPGTFADEVLKGSKVLLVVSLLFTAALCFFSYQFFLERFLSPGAALVAALLVTGLIEYGKMNLGLMSVRTPFLMGLRQVLSSPTQTFAWVVLMGFTVAVFSISVYNSTNGAARYAENTANERTEVAFVPNTASIDEQIAAARRTIDTAPKAKWKGSVYYQSPGTVKEAQKELTSLQAQKAEAVRMQRADFERTRGQADSANSHSATIALRIGGWLELCQVLLLLIIASCESILARRASRQSTPAAAPAQNGIGFRPNPAVATAYGTSPAPTVPENAYPATPNEGRVVVTGFGARPETTTTTVAQPTQPVAQMSDVQAIEQACENLLRYFQSNIPHYNRHDANPDTVTQRLSKKVAEIQKLLPPSIPFRVRSRRLLQELLSRPEVQHVDTPVRAFIHHAYGPQALDAYVRCQYQGASVSQALEALDYTLIG